MILGSDGKPARVRDFDPMGPLMARLEERMREAEATLRRALDTQIAAQDEAERATRFRRLNDLPVEYRGVTFPDESLTWDGAKYATYGSVKS